MSQMTQRKEEELKAKIEEFVKEVSQSE